MYSIIDIETTGGSPIRDSITEIAMFLYDGINIHQAFHSLINPETRIPYPISKLTGITNEMVAQAPRFYEIARELVLVTEGRTFVAHNVNFDYRFIKNGQYKGYGFIAKSKYALNKSKLFECIQEYEDNRDIRQIISGYVLKNKRCINLPID